MESSVKSPNGCRVILCIDANAGEDTTLPWIGSAGSRTRDRCKKKEPKMDMNCWRC